MEDFASTLIKMELKHPEIVNLLNDIRDFDWKLVSKLRKQDLQRVGRTGFHFSTTGIESQRQELKAFLIAHPSCMGSDFEIILNKLQIFGSVIYQLEREQREESKQASIEGEEIKAIEHEIIMV